MIRNFRFWHKYGYSYLRSRAKGVEELIYAVSDDHGDQHKDVINNRHEVNVDKIKELEKEFLKKAHSDIVEPHWEVEPIWKDVVKITIVTTQGELVKTVSGSDRPKAVFLGDNLFQKMLFTEKGTPVLFESKKVGLAGVFNLLAVPSVRIINYLEYSEHNSLGGQLRDAFPDQGDVMCQDAYNAGYTYSIEQGEKTLFLTIGWGSRIGMHLQSVFNEKDIYKKWEDII